MQLWLVGDSIRMGYEGRVREVLGEQADIWTCADNGGDSRNLLARFPEWLAGGRPELIHFNCGLHDIKRARPTGELQVPMEEYRDNLERIVDLISGIPALWATITPVIFTRHHELKDFDRYEADVQAYNTAALEIMHRRGIPVNDLYSLVMEQGPEELLGPDGVHYEAAGSRLLGDAVAAAILHTASG